MKIIHTRPVHTYRQAASTPADIFTSAKVVPEAFLEVSERCSGMRAIHDLTYFPEVEIAPVKIVS